MRGISQTPLCGPQRVLREEAVADDTPASLRYVISVEDALAERPYPGRGCIAARIPSGSLWISYFLTGRSEASRSRTLQSEAGGDLRVVDTRALGEHDHLRHYVAAARRDGWTVVGNGDQVEPLALALGSGVDPVAAWGRHTYEPDPPIFTPRIWLCTDPNGDVLVGSARRSKRDDGSADRGLWMPESLRPGSAIVITTYSGSAVDLETSGLPLDVTTEAESGEDLLNAIWDALDPVLRVAAFVAQPGDLAATRACR